MPPHMNITKRKENIELIEWADLSPWQKDNEFILTGYRRASHSLLRCLRSVFLIHNETFNIWSHVLASIAFCVVSLYQFSSRRSYFESAPLGDLAALNIFFATTTLCFVFSSSHHIFSNHSPRLSRLTQQLDHFGIVLPIWGTTISSVHFGYYCNPDLRSSYRNLATSSALLCTLATFNAKFRTPAGRRMRTLLFAALGASSFVPIFNGVRLYGFENYSRQMSLSYFLGLCAFHSAGAGFYGARVPERWYPRRYDILGASHQIMHLLVICGAFSYSVGIFKTFEYWNPRHGGARLACASLGSLYDRDRPLFLEMDSPSP